jgi:hypothetical protein
VSMYPPPPASPSNQHACKPEKIGKLSCDVVCPTTTVVKAFARTGRKTKARTLLVQDEEMPQVLRVYASGLALAHCCLQQPERGLTSFHNHRHPAEWRQEPLSQANTVHADHLPFDTA